MIVQVYHGSPNSFADFSFKKVGSEGGTSGAGFGLYFSESKTDALTYGKNVYTCLLSLQKNISNTEVTFNKKTLKVILDRLEKFGISYYEHFGYDEQLAIQTLLENDSDTEIIGDIVNSSGGMEQLFDILTKLGYTHTIDKETPADKTITHYIVYNLSSIKIQKKENLSWKN